MNKDSDRSPSLWHSTGTVSLATSQTERADQLRQEIDGQHFAVLRGFLSGSELERVLSEIRDADWDVTDHAGGTELIMVTNRGSTLLNFLMHSQELFGLIEELTGCATIGGFNGRVYRLVPGAGHAGDWHSDLVERRMAALSINLSEQPVEDGALEMRNSETKETLSIAPPLDCGDAVLIRLRQELEHRVRPLKGDNPKTAFAGFFYALEEASPLALPRTSFPGVGVA